MRIGILSDSHGRAEITRRAVTILLDAGSEMLMHLGDLESEETIDELAGHNAHIVFGNCDFNANSMAGYARHLDVNVDHPMGVIQVDSARIAFTHGHLAHLMRAALADGVDYLLHGHTHEMRDERIGKTRVINPGALFRASRYTAAVLDPETDQLEIIDVTS